jgi:cytidine deaminase
METRKQDFEYIVYNNIDELEENERELVQVAVDQLSNAYAPYSLFHVGAAVRLENNVICPGSNQENASYPLCMCGERVALYNAAANFPGIAPLTLAITIHNEKMEIHKPVSPCGACRQVIAEHEFRYKRPIRILLKSDGPQIIALSSVKDILPLGFDGSFL